MKDSVFTTLFISFEDAVEIFPSHAVPCNLLDFNFGIGYINNYDLLKDESLIGNSKLPIKKGEIIASTSFINNYFFRQIKIK